ncbi:MAG: peptide ABC transporter substrate-binding protein [Chloroflexi bacterium]|nr:peptide ABC transporter substrate-binding protein [Chloroflexota bacterium]
MKKSLLHKLPWAIALLVLATGCSALSPTPILSTPAATPTTLRPAATPLPTTTVTPSPTPAPPPTLTPTPSAGYYRNTDLGFWFLYPGEWQREETGSNFPAVVISDNDDPVRLMAGGRPIEDDTELADFARGVGEELGLAEEVELIADGPATLADGTPAWEVTFAWENDEGRAFQTQGYATISGGKGYVLVLTAHPEVLTTRSQTIQAIGHTLALEQPELYGVSRANAIVMLASDVPTLDPALTREGPGGIVAHIFGGLVRLNADLQVEPDLAERWDVSDDGTVYTFHLRPDVTFHSGAPLTAADVKQSWERAADPALGSPTAALYLGDIASTEAVDDSTLVVTLDGPKPYFLAKLAQPVAFVTQADNVAGGASWWLRPDGSGPFALRRWLEGEAIILERAETYHQPLAISAMIYLISGGSGFLAYEAGYVDVANVGLHNLARAQDPADPLSGDLISGNTFCTYRVVFDATRAPFDDPNVRRAFALAVDRDQLAQVVLNGAAVPAISFLPPGMPGHVDRPAADTFDVEAAQALIAASDYGSGSALPALTLSTPGVGDPDPLAVALADVWATNLGVTIETELLEPTGYADAITEQHGHLFTVESCADYADPENVLDLPYHTGSPANHSGYANAELDALLESARTESDPGQRLALYQQAEELLLEDAPAVPLVHPLAYVLIRPYIRGYRLSPIPVLWPAVVTIER